MPPLKPKTGRKKIRSPRPVDMDIDEVENKQFFFQGGAEFTGKTIFTKKNSNRCRTNHTGNDASETKENSEVHSPLSPSFSMGISVSPSATTGTKQTRRRNTLRQSSVKKLPETDDPYLFIEQARVSDNATAAVAVLTEARKLFPFNLHILFALSSAYVQLSDWGSAVDTCSRILQLDPSHLKAQMRTTKILRQSGCLDQAELVALNLKNSDDLVNDKIHEELLAIAKARNVLLELKSYIHDKPRAASIMIPKIKRLLEMCPRMPMGHLLFAVAVSGQSSTVNEHVENAHTFVVDFGSCSNHIRTQDSDFIASILRSLHRCGNTDQSCMLADSIIRVFEGTCWGLTNVCIKEKSLMQQMQKTKEESNELFEQKQYSKATSRYSEALLLDPEHHTYNSVILCNRAAAWMELKKYEEALRDCSSSLKKSPKYVKALCRRARVYMALNNPSEALRDFQTAFTESPDALIEREIKSIKEKLRSQREEKQREKYKSHHRRAHSYSSYESENNRSYANQKYAQKVHTHYSLLEVAQNATVELIRKSYLKKVLKCHPDKTQDKAAHEVFKRVAEAYEVLSDPVKRKTYDSTLLYSSASFTRW